MPDGRRPTEPWKVDDDITADRLEMMRTLAETAQLTAVGKNIRIYKNALGGTALAVDESPPAPSSQTLVKIDSNRTGGGFYKGYLWLAPTAAVAEGSNLTEAMLGTQGEEVTVANRQEIGGATHWLTHASNTNQKLFSGEFLPVRDSAGLRVVAINALWAKLCE